jgi:hypothetical protein
MRLTDWLASASSNMTIYRLRVFSSWQAWELIEQLRPLPQGSCWNVVLKTNQMVCYTIFNNRSCMRSTAHLYAELKNSAFAKELAAKVKILTSGIPYLTFIVDCTVSLARA